MDDQRSRSTRATAANRTKVAHLERVLADLLAEALERGWHGRISVELAVQDGTIQDVRRRLERVER